MQVSDTHDFTAAIEMETLNERGRGERAKTERSRHDYFVGVCLLLVVVLLWTLSNFVTQVSTVKISEDITSFNGSLFPGFV